jgi:hypothetical protein
MVVVGVVSYSVMRMSTKVMSLDRIAAHMCDLRIRAMTKFRNPRAPAGERTAAA